MNIQEIIFVTVSIGLVAILFLCFYIDSKRFKKKYEKQWDEEEELMKSEEVVSKLGSVYEMTKEAIIPSYGTGFLGRATIGGGHVLAVGTRLTLESVAGARSYWAKLDGGLMINISIDPEFMTLIAEREK